MIVKLIDLATSLAKSDDKAMLAWLLPKFTQALAILSPSEQRIAALTLLERLNFRREESLTRLDALFEHLVLPLMVWALEHDHHALGLILEVLVYEEYVKRVENEEHFQACISRWTPAMVAAGRRCRDGLPALPPRPPRTSKQVIGVYLHNSSLLAHVQMLLSMLEGYTSLEHQPYAFHIYVGKRGVPAHEAPFRALGLPMTFLNEREDAEQGLLGRCLALHEAMNADGVDILLWISRADQAGFAFALGLAPKQVFWAMKYHGFFPPDCQLGLSSMIPESTRPLLGHTWNGVFYSKKDWFHPDRAEAASKVRGRYVTFDVVLATLGREEKIIQPEFLEAVAGILRANPQACFLWTGRAENPAIKAALETAGVAAQCFYIGWVDTALYAQVIDIFLDSFPFGCGYTLMEAMAAGKAVVFKQPDNPNHLTNLCNMVAPLTTSATPEGERFREIMGADGLPMARDQDDYIAQAQHLIDDASARDALGQHLRRFVEEFAGDNRRSARQFVQHMESIA